MSIKPFYADQIFQGKKKYEYRRRIFKRRDVSSLVIYESAPVSLIVGEAKIQKILSGPINEIWERTGRDGGITLEAFKEYFKGCDSGYAIELCDAALYSQPMSIPSRPPQSFMYI